MPNLSSQRHDPVLLKLGMTIRRIRIAKGISQENLALMADVDRSYMGRIERGDNNVALLTLNKISHALGLPLAKLMQESKL